MSSSDPLDVQPLAAIAADMTTFQKIRLIGQSLLRTLAGLLVIWFMLWLVPENPSLNIWIPALLIAMMIVVYGWYFRLQLRRIHHAKYPQIQAAEALILVAFMFLAIFSVTYYTLSLASPNAFTEHLDQFSAFYFAVTVLATVGFGDITPVTVIARTISMVQMGFDIAFIAVALKIVGGATTKAIQSRTPPS